MSLQISAVYSGIDFLDDQSPILKKDQRKRQTISTKVSCKVCGKLFKTKEIMRRHLSTHMRILIEKPPLKWMSENVPKEPKPMPKSKKPLTVQKEPRKVLKPSEENFYCDLCNKFFKSEGTMKNHRMVHSDERRFLCPFCQKSFKCKKYLSSHLVTHSSERQFGCEICGAKFKWKHVLNNHVKKSHHN